ncbi:MAG: hypothetical protein KKF56_00755 [Nanoarchaeota archaeon]|nr:hypothetical protein [Nanoarchaeota archaeon]
MGVEVSSIGLLESAIYVGSISLGLIGLIVGESRITEGYDLAKRGKIALGEIMGGECNGYQKELFEKIRENRVARFFIGKDKRELVERVYRVM